MTKQTTAPRFDVLRDGIAVLTNVSKTTANEFIKKDRDAQTVARDYKRIPHAAAPAGDGMDIPPELQIPQAERDAHWEANPPKAMPAFATPRNESDEDRAAREKLLAEQAERKRTKTTARITKMKARAEEGRPAPGMRWDPSICKFVPSHQPAPSAKEAIMATKAKTTKAKTTKAKTTRGGSKREAIAALLKAGCTQDDLKKATGWAYVNIPLQARLLGLKIEKLEKDGAPAKYKVAK